MGSQSAPCIKHWWMNWPDWHDLFLKLIGLFQEPFPDVLVSKCKQQTKNKLLVEACVALIESLHVTASWGWIIFP